MAITEINRGPSVARRTGTIERYSQYCYYIERHPELTMAECALILGVTVKTLEQARRSLGYKRRDAASETANIIRSIEPGHFVLIPVTHESQVSNIKAVAGTRNLGVIVTKVDDKVLIART